MTRPGGRWLTRVASGVALGGALLLTVVGPAQGQELADFDYENLSFRGVGLDFGYMISSRVESTGTFGARADLGFLGPGVRVTAGFTRWSSFLKDSEVRTLEERVEELVLEQTGTATQVNLGRISWSDVAFNADAHMLWRIPSVGVYTYAGAGATAHVLRGGGEAIEDTFVEDLLDSIRAGLNIHGGVEIPFHPRFRVYGESRFEFMENLRYLQVKVGGQVMIGDAP